MRGISLVSLNVERSKHLDLVEKFLSSRPFDVVCLQELMQKDVDRLSHSLADAPCYFVPMGLRPQESAAPMGIGIFSRLRVTATDARYYFGAGDILPESTQSDASTYNTLNRLIAIADVEKDDRTYRICTTHFTWTPDGRPSDEQRHDMSALLDILGGLDEFVFCGDLNAPRGGEIFEQLAAKYKDNIPPQYKTSIDLSLHRAGTTNAEELSTKMVDGLFSTPGYVISDVELIPGVSDHMAIVATVSKGD